jgi:hypothetical protein
MRAVQENGAVVGGRGEVGTGWVEPLEMILFYDSMLLV